MSLTAFSFPTRTLYGAGALAELPAALVKLGVRRPLVVTDGGLVKTDAFAQLAAVMGADNQGKTWFVFDGVHPNPVEEDVRQAAAALRDHQCDGVIAIGGGSPLDAGKAARLLALRPGYDLSKFYEESDWSGLLPLVAIPTTAGTGSEATPWSVITDLKAHYKFGVGGTVAIPEVALVDPQLMLGLPPFLTAATGMDALSHLIEAFVSTNINPLLDPLILRGIELAGAQLLAAVRHGTDLTARAAMAQAALLGGIAISSNWLGACHSLSHQLSSFADVQHGLANAIMLPHQMRYSLPAALARYAQVGVALGSPAKGTAQKRAEFAVERVAALARDCGLPLRLRDAGVDAALLAPMAHSAFVNDSNHTTNPRPCTEASLAEMYQAAF